MLWQNDEISIQELAKKTALEKSTLTRMLERLENSGYLKRIPSKNDRRKTIVKLTHKNEKLKGDYEQVSNDILDLFYKGFTEQDIDIFEAYLNKIYSNLLNLEENLNKNK